MTQAEKKISCSVAAEIQGKLRFVMVHTKRLNFLSAKFFPLNNPALDNPERSPLGTIPLDFQNFFPLIRLPRLYLAVLTPIAEDLE